jgi:hypothetical protein
MKINRIEKQSLNAKPYCYNTKETNSFSEYIYKANEGSILKQIHGRYYGINIPM